MLFMSQDTPPTIQMCPLLQEMASCLFSSAGLEWLCILFSIVTPKTKPPAFKDGITVQTIGKLPVSSLQ